MHYELSRVAKQALSVIPVAVEAQDIAVMVKELLQSVLSLIWTQWLHALLHLPKKIILFKIFSSFLEPLSLYHIYIAYIVQQTNQ